MSKEASEGRTVLVAVYGTLKKGYNNHHVLGKEYNYLGYGNTQGKYDMKDAGFPAIVKNEEGKPVQVEVYEIPEDRLKQLDRLEGVPYMYTREKETIKVFLNMEEEEFLDDVFIYVGTDYFKHNKPYESYDHLHVWRSNVIQFPKAGRFA